MTQRALPRSALGKAIAYTGGLSVALVVQHGGDATTPDRRLCITEQQEHFEGALYDTLTMTVANLYF